MKNYNCGLLQEEILFDIILVVEYGLPAGPQFLFSLNTLLEAVIIHEKVYIDPANVLKRQEGIIQEILHNSNFLKVLLQENTIQYFKEENYIEIEELLNRNNYEYIEFKSEYLWTGATFPQPISEGENYQNLIDLLNFSKIYNYNFFDFDDFGTEVMNGVVATNYPFSPIILTILSSLGFTDEDKIILESYYKRAKSFLKFSQILNFTPYLSFVALPYFKTSLNNINKHQIKQIINLYGDYIDMDFKISSTFDEISFPPFISILLDRCSDASNAIASEICKMKIENKNLQTTLAHREMLYEDAKTVKDKMELDNMFQSALEILKKKGETRRFVYESINLLSNWKKILPIAASKLEEIIALRKVNGISDFYYFLQNTPLATRHYELLKKIFKNQIAEERIWSLGQDYSSNLKKNKLLF